MQADCDLVKRLFAQNDRFEIDLTALMTPNSSRGPGYFPNHQVDHAKLFIAATAMPACIIGLSLTQPSPAFLFPESSLPLRNDRYRILLCNIHSGAPSAL